MTEAARTKSRDDLLATLGGSGEISRRRRRKDWVRVSTPGQYNDAQYER
jgi:hypothetical protein